MSKIYEDNSFAIGNTPLVKLKSVTKNAKATVLAKIEGRNPAYSVKCRIGANMIWDAEKSGKLTKDKVIVEPTSGNTGIALAFTASARGYKLILTMPESMSIERRRVMAVLGAEIVLTEASKGMPGAIAKAKEIAESNTSKYFMALLKSSKLRNSLPSPYNSAAVRPTVVSSSSSILSKKLHPERRQVIIRQVRRYFLVILIL